MSCACIVHRTNPCKPLASAALRASTAQPDSADALGTHPAFRVLRRRIRRGRALLTLFFETLGAPLPGESALILASGAAAAGKLDIRAVVLAAWLGSILGDNAAYLIGRKLGRPAVLRYGGRVGVTEGAYAKAEAITHRYGPLMVVPPASW